MTNLGKKAKDKVTGFEGVITSKHSYLTGCSQYGLQPKVKEDGTVPDAKYFDEGRLTIGEVVVTMEDVAAKEDGCDERERPE